MRDSACAGLAAFMLFVTIGTTESEQSLADVGLPMESMHVSDSHKELSFINTTLNSLNDDITIEFYSSAPRAVELKMVSIAGKDLAQRKIFAKEGNNMVTWRYNAGYKGICYLYICADEKTSEVIKVVRN